MQMSRILEHVFLDIIRIFLFLSIEATISYSREVIFMIIPGYFNSSSKK